MKPGDDLMKPSSPGDKSSANVVFPIIAVALICWWVIRGPRGMTKDRPSRQPIAFTPRCIQEMEEDGEETATSE